MVSRLRILVVRDSLRLPLLAVVGHFDYYLSRVFDFRSFYLKSIFADNFSFQLLSRESSSNIANSRLLEAFRNDGHLSFAFQWSANWSDLVNDRLFVVGKLDVLTTVLSHDDLFTSIDSNSDQVAVAMASLAACRVFVYVKGLEVGVTHVVLEGRGVAHDEVVFHDGGVGEDGLVEDAHSFVVTEVNEVLAMYFDLSVAGIWAADRTDGVDDRCFIVEVWDGRRPEIIFKRNPQVNKARLVVLGDNTLDLTGR